MAMTWETRLGVLVCDAVEGRFLQAGTMAELRSQALGAQGGGAAAVFVGPGPLGDPIVLAAGLAGSVLDVQVGVRLGLTEDGRHPAMLARELTSLDLVCQGRSVVCFEPPFAEPLAEAISLCRELWRSGAVARDGPHFPAQAPASRARPMSEEAPLVGLDLTAGHASPGSLSELVDLVDLVLRPTPDPMVCRMERV
jgi:alkanesulfonate monooxygenase SsuD/methylene tetrahydromethanopterin reductase-like flavin-dependent oxidoreductase (luciferase family)